MTGPGTARDAVRLVVGTLTVLPVRPPGVVDRTVGGRAMTLAPLVGLALAVPGAAALVVLDELGSAAPLSAVLVLGTLAVATRAMHLDGLADTADGLGSGRPPAEALEVMRRSDIGPFGVVTLVVAVLVEVFALAQLVAEDRGVVGLVVALVTSRLALALACSRGVPAARKDGLGQVVAGSVGRLQLAISVVLAVLAAGSVLLLTGALGRLAPDLGGLSQMPVAGLVAAPVLGLSAGALLGLRCVRRLGGVTGDVLGACVEVTFAATLVVLALG